MNFLLVFLEIMWNIIFRSKDNWIQLLKMNILQQVGRGNSSAALIFNKSSPLNLTQIFPNNPNDTNSLEEFISKKIRTFYSSCEFVGISEEWEEYRMNFSRNNLVRYGDYKKFFHDELTDEQICLSPPKFLCDHFSITSYK